MSDYELIMMILEVMTVVIAFGALVAFVGYRTKRVGTLIPIIER